MAAITPVDANNVGTIFPGGVSVHAGVYSITDGDTLTLGSAVQAVVATDAQNTSAAAVLPIGARISTNVITFNHNDGGAASVSVVAYYYK